MSKEVSFNLSDSFISKYVGKQPKWGPIGYVTFKRTYARNLDNNGKTEEYWQTAKRVVEGTFTVQKRHCKQNKLPWHEGRAKRSAERMFELMWDFKFTPPGRGLWMMGTDYVYNNGGAALNNCAFVSTENLDTNFSEPFCFLMDMSMVGVGVGADVKGAGKVTIKEPKYTDEEYFVADSREGWIDLLRMILDSYVGCAKHHKKVNYEKVRKYGSKINGFGGVSSGPEPLQELIKNVIKLLDDNVGNKIRSDIIVDIFNFIGRCVVAGNVRRTAEIMFGDPNDDAFLELKNPDKHKKELMYHRWASNNSIFAEVGMDYSKVAELTAKNGEPGYEWLANAQAYSRMGRKPDNKDYRARGGNPCLEQTLEPYELCCLVETYPSNHNNLDEWLETLKYAYMYAKTVTLIPTHHDLTNSVMMRNRRIGCSISGMTQAFTKFGRRKFFNYCDVGYKKIQQWDTIYSDWLGIPRSLKTTSIKPSGTVSLLAGVTPGIHYPISEYYIRNVRFPRGSMLLGQLKDQGYSIEKDKYSDNSYVVSFPVKEEYFTRSASTVSMWEQLENVAQIQEHWADNQVSVTVTFKKEEATQIKYALELYETRLKGVSFLPATEHGFQQAPYIPITKEKYEELKSNITKKKLKGATHEAQDLFCDGESCQIAIVKGD